MFTNFSISMTRGRKGLVFFVRAFPGRLDGTISVSKGHGLLQLTKGTQRQVTIVRVNISGSTLTHFQVFMDGNMARTKKQVTIITLWGKRYRIMTTIFSVRSAKGAKDMIQAIQFGFPTTRTLLGNRLLIRTLVSHIYLITIYGSNLITRRTGQYVSSRTQVLRLKQVGHLYTSTLTLFCRRTITKVTTSTRGGVHYCHLFSIENFTSSSASSQVNIIFRFFQGVWGLRVILRFRVGAVGGHLGARVVFYYRCPNNQFLRAYSP